MKQLIRELESDEGFFSRVQTISFDTNVPLFQAWEKVEGIREELGLNHKYPTVRAFYEARRVYHRVNGQIYRLQPEAEDVE